MEMTGGVSNFLTIEIFTTVVHRGSNSSSKRRARD